METVVATLFLRNWPQKAVALLAAIILWFFVSQSIMETKAIPSVPIRVINIPSDHTILGLMPNGILNKRLTLTLTGTKDVIEDLEPGDLEVVVDASIIDHSDWVLRISKNNLLSLTSTDLPKHINSLSHSEYVIKIRPMVTERIPVNLLSPVGEPPPGYEFLGIWPQKLDHTYSGAEEEIQQIKTKGLEFQFDLSRISKAELDSLASAESDEITYYLPSSWKRLDIPCKVRTVEELNDPEAKDLQIDLLKKQVYPIETDVPIRVFYPPFDQDRINPATYPLAINGAVSLKQGITVFTPKLYVHDVTREFLNIIQDHLEIVITASSHYGKHEPLKWSIDIINPHELEEKYVASLFELHPRLQHNNPQIVKERSKVYRQRFREYMEKFELYTSPDTPLTIEAYMGDGKILVSPN